MGLRRLLEFCHRFRSITASGFGHSHGWTCVAEPETHLRVYQLLGEAGTYYGVRFGKTIPWVTEFPFGVIKDPQYVGSIMSLLACFLWVPFQYILLWVLGYVFMMHVKSKEDPSTRAKPLH
ncbi:hypothetical protein JHK86_017383 [Glycine max]|nr:hypothetical protein JHK86_017383 [Glycine max]